MQRITIALALLLLPLTVACGGEPEASCECEAGEFCDEGVCVPVDVLGLMVDHHAMLDGDSVLFEMGLGHACASRADGTPPLVWETVAEEGDCVAGRVPEASNPGVELFAADAGDLELRGGDPSPISFVPSSQPPCLVPDVPNDTGAFFAPGDSLTFTGTGGAHFPAFEGTLVAPPLATFEAGVLTPGEPYTVTFEGGIDDDLSIQLMALGGEAPNIVCTPSQAGNLTISGTLTALLGGEEDVFLSASRMRVLRIDPEPSAVIELMVSSSASSFVVVAN